MNIVLSGTSSGLGLALARRFLANGERVVGLSRSAGPLQGMAGYEHHALDLADREAVHAAARHSGLDSVDLLIHNAGLPGSGRRLIEVEPEEVQELLNVNLFGALHLVQAFLPHLRRGVPKRIVHVSSRFGSLSFNRQPENRPLSISYSYRISKAAQNMLAVCLANELEGEGFRVDVVHPGSFQSRCGRASATDRPETVAQRFHEWILSGERPEMAVLDLEGGAFGW